MTRPRKDSPSSASVPGASRPAWACQLISFQIGEAGVILDLVALEPRPGHALGWPRGTPFSVHMGLADVSAEAVEPVLTAWADSSDVVAISARQSHGCRWLRFTAQDTSLDAKLVDPRGPTSP